MLILGCGLIGRALARHYCQQGEQVIGVVRSAASYEAVAASGAEPLALDLEQDALSALPCTGETIFHLAPPPPTGEEDALSARLVEHFACCGHPRRLVYMSTTGVYGDCAGAWVDETHPTRPDAARSKRRLDAEQRLTRWAAASGVELIILRVAGIYAAERLPLARLRQGLPVVLEAESPWSNRIHADDLVTICCAAMDRAPAGAIYNVSDGHPSTMTDYFNQVATAAGLPLPPQVPLAEAAAHLSAGMLSYMQESRRLDNRKLLTELGVSLRYPTLTEGLAACAPSPT